MKIKTASRLGEVKEYYFSQKLREIAQLRAQGVDIINLGIGSPDQMPPEPVLDELLDVSRLKDSHGYQSYAGIPPLRNAFANWYDRHFGVSIDPETEVLPLIGSKEGIMHLSMTYLETGDEVLVPDPGYPTYQAAAALTGATVRKYDLTAENGWFPDLDLLSSQYLDKVKMMWINYPHMPTGTDANLDFFNRLVAFAKRNEILLCHDNPYAFILTDHPSSIFQAEGAKDVAVELNSLSKTFNMAGWRIGMLAGNKDRMKEVLRFKSNMDSGMFKPVQMAAVKALSLPDSWYEGMNEIYQSRRGLAEDLLQSLGCEVDSQQVGMFVWGRIPREFSSGFDLADLILDKARVFITPGNIFGKNGAQYVRVSLCSSKEVFNEALERCRVIKMHHV